jgi:hypothetical protein
MRTGTAALLGVKGYPVRTHGMLTGYSWGTQSGLRDAHGCSRSTRGALNGVLTWHSRGTHAVLKGYSRGTEWGTHGVLNRRAASTRSFGAHCALKGYSRGTRWVLDGNSRGTHQASNTVIRCPLCAAVLSSTAGRTAAEQVPPRVPVSTREYPVSTPCVTLSNLE